jgi:hypothetical protein
MVTAYTRCVCISMCSPRYQSQRFVHLQATVPASHFSFSKPLIPLVLAASEICFLIGICMLVVLAYVESRLLIGVTITFLYDA